MPDILTKMEVAKYMTFPYMLEGETGHKALATIEAMAELLERWNRSLIATQCDQLAMERDTESLLATYHGTKGGDE